jgi:hypothetical protein
MKNKKLYWIVTIVALFLTVFALYHAYMSVHIYRIGMISTTRLLVRLIIPMCYLVVVAGLLQRTKWSILTIRIICVVQILANFVSVVTYASMQNFGSRFIGDSIEFIIYVAMLTFFMPTRTKAILSKE